MLACALVFLDPMRDWSSACAVCKTWSETITIAAARIRSLTLDLRVPRTRRFLAEASPLQWTTTWAKHLTRVVVQQPAHWSPLHQLHDGALQHLALLTRAPGVVDVAFERIGEPTHRKLTFDDADQVYDVHGSAYMLANHAAAVFPVLPLQRLVLDGPLVPVDLFTRFPMVWSSLRELHLGCTHPGQWLTDHVAWMRTRLTSLRSLRIDDLVVDDVHLFAAPYPCYLHPTIVAELAAWTTLDCLDLAGDVKPEERSRSPTERVQWTPTSVRFGVTNDIPGGDELCALELLVRRRPTWETVTLVVDEDSVCLLTDWASWEYRATRRIVVSNRLVVEPASNVRRRALTADWQQRCKTWIDSAFSFEPGATLVFL